MPKDYGEGACEYCKEKIKKTGFSKRTCTTCLKHINNISSQVKRDIKRFNEYGSYFETSKNTRTHYQIQIDILENTKLCGVCKTRKNLSEFHKRVESSDGATAICKKCKYEVKKELLNNSPSARLAMQDAHRKFLYKMPRGMYSKILELQDGCCKICGRSEKRLVVDHDHNSGNVRGLLCRSCNTGIGLFLDNTDYLQKAIYYLKGGAIETVSK